jgi:hypothetical protein
MSTPLPEVKEGIRAMAGGNCRCACEYHEPRERIMTKMPTTMKAAKSRKAAAKKSCEPKAKKLGALDAAAQVLTASKEPLNCKAMIDAMAKKALWTSPGGKTPHATLYSAIIREIALKGKESRFVKTERGKFAAK